MEERARQLFWARLIGVGIAALVVGWYITLEVWLPPPIALDQARGVVVRVLDQTRNTSRLQVHLNPGEGSTQSTRVAGEVELGVLSSQVVIKDVGGVLAVELPRASVLGVRDLQVVDVSGGDSAPPGPDVEALARQELSELARRADLLSAVEKSITEQVASEMRPYGYLVDVSFMD